MYIYEKLNKKNIRHFMENNYDEEIYERVWNAVYTLSICGFKDMKELHALMAVIDNKLFDDHYDKPIE